MDEQLLEKTRLLSGAGLFMAIHRLNCIWSCVAFFLLPALPSMTMIQRRAKKPNDYYARARAREAGSSRGFALFAGVEQQLHGADAKAKRPEAGPVKFVQCVARSVGEKGQSQFYAHGFATLGTIGFEGRFDYCQCRIHSPTVGRAALNRAYLRSGR